MVTFVRECVSNSERTALEAEQIELEGLGAAARLGGVPGQSGTTAPTTTCSWTSGNGAIRSIPRGSMAIHIDNVESSGIRQVDKAGFYEQLEWGDLIFCCGREQISKEI